MYPTEDTVMLECVFDLSVYLIQKSLT
jgi:hypothetical protein